VLERPMFATCAGTRLKRQMIEYYGLETKSNSQIEGEPPLVGSRRSEEGVQWVGSTQGDGRKIAPARPRQLSSYLKSSSIHFRRSISGSRWGVEEFDEVVAMSSAVLGDGG
jgi:hypothetical protein